MEGSEIITDVKCIINGRASDPSSQVIADGGRRDVVGEVVVEGDVEDGHPAVDRCSLFTLLLPIYMIETPGLSPSSPFQFHLLLAPVSTRHFS